MSRNQKARARARRAAARLSPPPSKGGARGGIHGASITYTRPLHLEQLEPRRVLAPIVVTTPLDVVDFNDGLTSLREAIFAANTVPGPDEIAFDFGHDGRETILLTHGELTVTDSLTITGPSRDLLTIDASGSDPTPDVNNGDGSRIFNIDDGVKTLSRIAIANMTLTGGDVNGRGGAVLSREDLQLNHCRFTTNSAEDGGGLAVERFGDAATLEVVQCEFRENSAKRRGGGVFHQFGTATFRDTNFEGNSAVEGGGAYIGHAVSTFDGGNIRRNSALQGGGLKFFNSTVDGRAHHANLINLSISGNTASSTSGSGEGGGVYFTGPGSSSLGALRVQSSTISGNFASRNGGGVYADRYPVSLVDSVVSHNRAGDDTDLHSLGEGGGIYLRRCSATIERTTITSNYAKLTGGGIAFRASDNSLRIISILIATNEALSGAGLFIAGYRPNTNVSNSTITGNTASGSGGGIQNSGSIYSPLSLSHSTVTGNRSRSVGGINSDGRSTPIFLSHSIVADNRNLLGAPRDLSGLVGAIHHSLIGYANGADLGEHPLGAPDANGNLIGGPIHGAIDPLLAPLADNGGPTHTHALLPGSPAIDAGDSTLRPGVGDTPQFDQRGEPFSRVVGARIDIGAVEQAGVPFIVDTLIDESDGNFARGDLSLREAIELANAQSGADAITFDPALFAAGPATILLTHGELAITDSLTITGPGRDLLTIDASGSDPTPNEKRGDGSRVFDIRAGLATNTQLASLTLTGGDTAADGGAVRATSPLVVEQSTLLNNQARYGGAIWATADVSVIDSMISGNSAASGGGVFVNATRGRVNLLSSSISRNLASFTGGGLFASNAAVSIVDCLVSNNQVGEAGSTVAGYGGGLFLLQNSVTILRSTIAMNIATGYGGGLHAFSVSPAPGTTLNISSSLITGNSGLVGGGLDLQIGRNNAAQVSDSTVTGNSATLRGGGMNIEGTKSSFRLTRSTVTNNEATGNAQQRGAAGGISAVGSSSGIKLDHSIVAGNRHSISTTVGADVLGRISEMRFTLLGQRDISNNPETSVGTPDANGNLIGGPIHGPIDPLLAPLADNGGPTLTHALLPGSPAINAGDPNLTPGQGGAPEFDQRGAPFTRVAGGRIDIGAFELQSPSGALQADFDLDGDADGNDFLTWQRNLGKTTGATVRQGDGTADGDVDREDLAVWRARFSALGGAASDQTLNPTPSERQVVRAAAATSRRSPFLAPVAPTTGSLQRSARPQLTRAPLAPTPRTALNASNSAALDAAYQGERVAAPARHEDANDPETDDLIAALDAALSDG